MACVLALTLATVAQAQTTITPFGLSQPEVTGTPSQVAAPTVAPQFRGETECTEEQEFDLFPTSEITSIALSTAGALEATGQSFVAPCSGTLEGFTFIWQFDEIQITLEQNGTVLLYQGEGTGGAVLASQGWSLSGIPGAGAYFIGLGFETAAEITAGQTYTVFVDQANGEFAPQFNVPGDPYPAGTQYITTNGNPADAFVVGWGADTEPGDLWVSLNLNPPVAMPAPEIDVTPTSLAFGSVDVGSSEELSVTISNTGDAELTLGYSISGDGFAIVGGPSSVAAGGSETATVSFSPTAAGAASGTFTITSNDDDEGTIEVSLSGTGEEVVVPEPEIDVTPLALDFGSVDVGSSEEMMVTIANTGDAELTLGYSISGDGFSIVGGPETVEAGGSAMATLAFSPTAAGAASGTFTITSNDADEPSIEIDLSGTGEEVVEPEPEIDVSPEAVDFGAVEVGSSEEMMVTIANTGDAELTLGYSISGDGFAIVGGPSSVAAGGSETATLAFSPAAAGAASGTFTITSNDADEPSIEVALSGTGEEVVEPEPEIDVTPLALDFGTIEVGSMMQMSVTISNTGDAELTLGYGISGDGFSIVGGPESLAAGASEDATLAFAPAAAGAAMGTFTITSNDADEPSIEVALSGEGMEDGGGEPVLLASFDGDTSDGDTFNRAFVDEGVCGLSGLGSAVRYKAFDLSTDTSGDYSVAASYSGFDGYLYVYTTFDPDNACDNLVAFDDDGPAGTADSEIESVMLMAGVGYTIVVTGFENEDFGAFAGSVEGPEGADVSVEPVDDGGEPPVCDYAFSASALDGTSLPSMGGKVRLRYQVVNNGDEAVMVDVWGVASQDGTDETFVSNVRMPTVAGGGAYSARYFQRVPAEVEDGTYTYTLFVGDYNGDDPSMSEVCDSVDFTVVKGDVDAEAFAEMTRVKVLREGTQSAAAPGEVFSVTGDEIRVGPNPVRDAVSFTFATEASGEVSLTVYDTRGRTMATVLDGTVEAGQHTATLRDALPAGVYVWRLVSGDRVQTGRITVVR